MEARASPAGRAQLIVGRRGQIYGVAHGVQPFPTFSYLDLTNEGVGRRMRATVKGEDGPSYSGRKDNMKTFMIYDLRYLIGRRSLHPISKQGRREAFESGVRNVARSLRRFGGHNA
jgi:hypothetical protein